MRLGRTHGGVEDLVHAVGDVEHLVAVEREVRAHSPRYRTFQDTGIQLDVEALVLDLGILQVGGSAGGTGDGRDAQAVQHVRGDGVVVVGDEVEAAVPEAQIQADVGLAGGLPGKAGIYEAGFISGLDTAAAHTGDTGADGGDGGVVTDVVVTAHAPAGTQTTGHEAVHLALEEGFVGKGPTGGNGGEVTPLAHGAETGGTIGTEADGSRVTVGVGVVETTQPGDQAILVTVYVVFGNGILVDGSGDVLDTVIGELLGHDTDAVHGVVLDGVTGQGVDAVVLAEALLVVHREFAQGVLVLAGRGDGIVLAGLQRGGVGIVLTGADAVGTELGVLLVVPHAAQLQLDLEVLDGFVGGRCGEVSAGAHAVDLQVIGRHDRALGGVEVVLVGEEVHPGTGHGAGSVVGSPLVGRHGAGSTVLHPGQAGQVFDGVVGREVRNGYQAGLGGAVVTFTVLTAAVASAIGLHLTGLGIGDGEVGREGQLVVHLGVQVDTAVDLVVVGGGDDTVLV